MKTAQGLHATRQLGQKALDIQLIPIPFSVTGTEGHNDLICDQIRGQSHDFAFCILSHG